MYCTTVLHHYVIYLGSINIPTLPRLWVVVSADARAEPLVGVAGDALDRQADRVPLCHRSVRQEYVGVGIKPWAGNSKL